MKTPPSSVRFDVEELEFIKEKEKLTSAQKVVDFLLHQYYILFSPPEQSRFKIIEIKSAKIKRENGNAIGQFEADVEDYDETPISYNEYLSLIPKLESIEECQQVSNDIDKSDFAPWQKVELKKRCVARSQHPDLN